MVMMTLRRNITGRPFFYWSRLVAPSEATFWTGFAQRQGMSIELEPSRVRLTKIERLECSGVRLTCDRCMRTVTINLKSPTCPKCGEDHSYLCEPEDCMIIPPVREK